MWTAMLLVAVVVLASLHEGHAHLLSKRAPTDFECPFPDGMFADPKTCRRFYMCGAGHPFLQSCPPSLYFDDIKKFCTRKNKELTCGPVPYTTEAPTTPDPQLAPKCNPAECQLPDCFCSSDGTRVPGGLEVKEVPQMILMSFDGALNVQNYDLYKSVVNDTFRNPNGCPIKATFFVPHEYTSYYHVQKMYSDGHEIGLNSISYREPEDWWSTASYGNWTEEMIGMREILHKFANASRDHILGMRSPFLKSGGNRQMSMAYEYGLVYDSSIAVPTSHVPLWPYTLDYRMPHTCLSSNCPTHSFPGVWEVPLNQMHSFDGTGGSCALADQCVFAPDEDQIYDFLMENFLRHYRTNRAPMGLYFRVNWFHDELKIRALNRFIETVTNDYPDAWFTTIQQALLWIREPTVVTGSSVFKPWACAEKREPACNLPRTCALPFSTKKLEDVRYMQTCVRCPETYPWVENFEGAYKGHSIMELTKESELDSVPDNKE